MNQGMIATKLSKTQYSEQEAAKELGITVEDLRTLVRSHIAEIIHRRAIDWNFTRNGRFENIVASARNQ